MMRGWRSGLTLLELLLSLSLFAVVSAAVVQVMIRAQSGSAAVQDHGRRWLAIQRTVQLLRDCCSQADGVDLDVDGLLVSGSPWGRPSARRREQWRFWIDGSGVLWMEDAPASRPLLIAGPDAQLVAEERHLLLRIDGDDWLIHAFAQRDDD